MTSVPRQLAIFAAVLAVLFAGGYGAGHLIGDDDSSHGDDGHGTPAEPAAHGTAHNPDNAGHAGAPEAAAVRGLAATQGDLRLTVGTEPLARGAEQQVRFQVLSEDGDPVTDYDVVHTKRMHLIVVRRDMAGFQHLHPELDESGTWTAAARFDEPGEYRLFADFAHDGTQYTLAGDLEVEGGVGARPLPPPETVATAPGGYDVRIDAGTPRAGQGAELAFEITRGGEPVETETYLGAGGHLVALRENDLAFLHVHPEGSGVAFAAEFPSAGLYRLFLQFQHEGTVRTAEFTLRVGG